VESEDEPELGGGQLMDILTHVTSAIKDIRVSEGSEEKKSGGKALTNMNILKEGTVKVVAGAIGMSGNLTSNNDRQSVIGGGADTAKDKLIETLK
jgi:hypothetical protein